MQVKELIEKKKQGKALTRDELYLIVQGYTAGAIPDYQMAAFLMAVCFQGMTDKETADFTLEMMESGDTMDLSDIPGIKADKHSTGGIGDKTTLILGPVMASLGVPVVKMSGRGLGSTGGTIDKLESIPGFSSALTEKKMKEQVRKIGFADAEQTKCLVPADKKIYALRDVTATVDSIPLIASSIMSKKLACGADVLVLDVKAGSGAFMKTVPEAEKLAGTMMKIGEAAGKKVTAVITDMNEPLGRTVGNALEVQEAISFLKNPEEADSRLARVVMALAEEMMILSGKAEGDRDRTRKDIEETISSGRALKKFREFVDAQGGNPDVTEDFSLFPGAAFEIPVYSERDGYLVSCDAELVGRASMELGAGRQSLKDEIDPGAGIRILQPLGSAVRRGTPIALLYTSRKESIAAAKQMVSAAYSIGNTKIPEGDPVIRVIRK